MNRDGLSVDQAKALADELTRLVAALEADLSGLIDKEYGKLLEALLPPSDVPD
jgi:hypothetical protein